MKFRFKTVPYKHQLTALEKSCEKDEYALLMDMGTGKSKVLIDTIAHLYSNGRITSAVIFAPKGVYKNWVDQEVPTHMPDHIDYKMAYWASPLTAKLKKKISSIWRDDFDLHILVVNIEAISGDKAINVVDRFISNHFGKTLVAVDESTTIKNHKAKRTKSAIKIAKKARYKRILTGSPITKSPLDLYSQFAFLNEQLLGFQSYYSFCTRYADMIKRSAGSHHYNQILSYRNLDELTKSIQPFSYRVRKEDCLDLPEKNYMKRTIQLTPEQKTVYDDLKKTAVSILNEQDQVTATTQLTCLLRLHQVSCGFVNTDEGEVLELKNSRLEELVSILDETDGKVLIWATYRHDIRAIENKIKVLYGEDSVVSYYGDTKGEVRQELVNKFQNDTECKYFVGHPKTGGYGLTLVAANTVIYYSNNYDLEVRLQSEDRAHRIGQKSKVTYIDLIAEKTVDELIVKALRNKIDIATQVLGENFKKWLI